MLEVALASLRFGASMAMGRPFHQRSLERILEAMRDTQQEFGSVGDDSSELLGGPEFDDETRAVMQGRRFRTLATRAATETRYYGELFRQRGIEPRGSTLDDVTRVPLTPKHALRADPEAFVAKTAKPGIRATTTGTTGWPTSVYFSYDELNMIGALSAISLVTRRLIEPDDIVQISISTRAALGVLGVSSACSVVGVPLHVAGLVPPEYTLKLLSEEHRHPRRRPKVSVMSTYPSYLGLLVDTGLRMGYRPSDFGLRRIFTGGEILTDGLRRRSAELFGPVEIIENYGMTELAPLVGNLCTAGHLHFEPSVGLIEIRSLESDVPAAPGEPGRIVATPLPPFRQSTLVLRYDTEDVVRPLAGPFACNLRNMPAASNLLGKLKQSVRHDGGWTLLRDVVEALEAVDAVPLPARYGFTATRGGVAVEVAVSSDRGLVRAEIADELERREVPLGQLRVVTNPRELERAVPLRCDLREGSFLSPARDAPLASSRPSAFQPV